MTKDDEQNIKYILYQTKHGVSLEDTLLNLGYVKINPKQKGGKVNEV